ncbi:MAG: transporter substrate-binding domain-containing protein [Lachnospiraceae bacterium]|nr:transporter substrate-binding domain-containing protein [Lachnospiraceae bacterium]
MKKKLALLLAAVMSVSLCACGSSNVPANKVNSIDDLEGKKIGVQLGTTGDIYASDIKDVKMERYNKGTDAVAALKQGKIDCVIIDEQPAKVFVENNSDLKILEEPFENEDYAICLAKENTELKDKIDAALAELKEEGTLDKIISNYIGEDAGKTPYTSPADTKRDNGTLKMATNAEFPPYEYIEGGKVIGIDVDMAQAVADKLGMELSVDNIEFDAIITAVTTGKADIGVAGMTVTEDRLENVNFTDSYTTAKQVIIVRKK